MDSIKLLAPAKINLSLDVCGRLPNGYHQVRMVMQTVDLCDHLTLTVTENPGATMEANVDHLPLDASNLCIKAANLMFRECPQERGIHIKLDKQIFAAAGLAGGSTDAAAVMAGMNRLFDMGFSERRLMELAVEIGADVPYCILQGTALAEGIGEKLTALKPLEGIPVLLAKPPIDVSTKFVYTALDALEDPFHADVDAGLAAIEKRDIKGICAALGNSLEYVTIPKYPVVEELKQSMLEEGALGAMMSGSGPTVFGIFDSEEAMDRAKQAIERSGKADVRACHMIAGRKEA